MSTSTDTASSTAENTSDDGKIRIVIAHLYRKPTLTPEEFYQHWHEKHAPLVIPLMKRYGVLHYHQIHTPKSLIDSHDPGHPAIPADGTVLLYCKDWDLLQKLFIDPEYLGPVVEDEERFLDRTRMDTTFGYDMKIF